MSLVDVQRLADLGICAVVVVLLLVHHLKLSQELRQSVRKVEAMLQLRAFDDDDDVRTPRI